MSEEKDNTNEFDDGNAGNNNNTQNNLNSDGKNKDNGNEKKDDCKGELCEVLDKLKEALRVNCEEKKHSDRNSEDNAAGDPSSKERPSKEEPSKEEPSKEQPSKEQPSKEQPSKEQLQENQPSTQQMFSIKSPCCIKVKFINKIKGVCKRKNNECPERKGDMDFVDCELEKVRPKKTIHNKKCGCAVILLVLGLFVPLILLFLRSFCQTQNAVILDNNKVSLAFTTRSESNEDKSESSNNKNNGESVVVFGTAVLDGDNARVKQDGKSDLVVERKQKESCCREILWGISTIVFMGGIVCIIVMYIKYLRVNEEREYDIDNSILEFNKRAYFELLKLRTSELAIKQMTMEQELELKKQSALSNIDERQRSADSEWKRESKHFDLQEKYLEKVAEIANKYFETHHVERTERDLRKEVKHDFDVDIERH